MKLEPLETSQYYHFFNRGNNTEIIFTEAENYVYFLKLIEKYLIPIADIYSYCLLPNHFHLILRIKDNENLPYKYKDGKTKIYQAFSNLFNAYVKAYNKKYNRKGSLFQKSPKRILIQDETYLKNLIVYVNINPTHHNYSDYKNYKFSSYSALISKKPTLLKRLEVIELFEDIDNLKFNLEYKKLTIELTKDVTFE